MKNKLENLISFDDFKSNWKAEQSKKTKRTDVALDILKEGIEEIIPAGLPEMTPKYGMDYEEKLNKVIDFLNNEPNDDVVDAMVNELRDVLLEMEQMGFVDEDTTDELDDRFDGDWLGWIKEVVNLEDFPEEGLNNLIGIINDVEAPEFEENEDDDEYEDENIESDEDIDELEEFQDDDELNKE